MSNPGHPRKTARLGPAPFAPTKPSALAEAFAPENMCSNPFCLSPAWWLWRGVHTRSHPELGRKSPQRQWYFVSRRGRVGRRQACKRQKTTCSRTPSGEHPSITTPNTHHKTPARQKWFGGCLRSGDAPTGNNRDKNHAAYLVGGAVELLRAAPFRGFKDLLMASGCSGLPLARH